jgi:hypothetical protein
MFRFALSLALAAGLSAGTWYAIPSHAVAQQPPAEKAAPETAETKGGEILVRAYSDVAPIHYRLTTN